MRLCLPFAFEFHKIVFRFVYQFDLRATADIGQAKRRQKQIDFAYQ
jgi:hypothetical protein